MRDFKLGLRGVGFAVLLILLGCHLALLTTEFFPVDDAYISFRYAANLAQGEGLVFNPGERVEGYSNFLFVILLAASSKLGITPPLAARLINLASLVFLVGLLVYGRHGNTSRRVHAGLGWLAGLFLVLSPHTALNVLSGLETPTTAALLAAGVLFLGRGRPRLAAVSFLVVALSRPEGIVLALGAAAWDVWRGRDQVWSRILNWLALLVGPYTLFFLWRVIYYGSPLPNSVRAKSGSSTGWHIEQTLSYMARAVDAYWPLMFLAVMGLLARRVRSVQPRAAWLMLLGVIGLCFLTGSGDPYRTLLRYLYPALPLLLIVASASTKAWWQLAAALNRPQKVLLTSILALLLTSQFATLIYQSGFEILRKETFKALARVGLKAKMASGSSPRIARLIPPSSFKWRSASTISPVGSWIMRTMMMCWSAARSVSRLTIQISMCWTLLD